MKLRKAYETGYGKPPKEKQFKKGKSGNPSGRPKGARNLRTIVEEALGKEVQARHAGRPVKMTAFELMMASQVSKAAHGDVSAARLMIELAHKIGAFALAPQAAADELSAEDRQIVEMLLQDGQEDT